MVADETGTSIEKPKDRRMLRTPDYGDCQVCLQKAHGIHFGVLSCRACAAFFRRTVVLLRTYGCRRADGGCDVRKGERFLCRMCRYNKCLRLGMTPENVRSNRDTSDTTAKLEIIHAVYVQPVEGAASRLLLLGLTSLAMHTAQIQFAGDDAAKTSPIFNENGLNSQKEDIVLRKEVNTKIAPPIRRPLNTIEQVVEQGKAAMTKQLCKIFDELDVNTEVPQVSSYSALERMRTGIVWSRQTQNMQPEIVEVFSVEDCQTLFVNNLYKTAKWFMFCEEFARLSMEDKLSIFRSTWANWQTLERIDLSVEIFGDRFFNEKLTVMTNEKAAFADKLNIDLSSLTNRDTEMFRDMLKNLSLRMFDEVAKPVLEMQLSQMEIAYMQCQVAFHVEGKSVSETSQRACIAFRNRISNDLHDYYVKVIQQPNYANRLIKMMDLISSIENVQTEKAKMLELASLFDMIKINVSEENLI